MTESVAKTESKLEKVLASGVFAVTSELGPPKCADAEIVRTKAKQRFNY